MDVKKITGSQNAQKMELSLTVNGSHKQLQVAPAARLVDILREDLGLTGTKIACEIGRCGSCAVHLDGQLVNSCLVLAYQANHSSIQTIEGVAEEELDPIQQAFLEEGGYQCGYCTPGMIMAVKALLAANPAPSREQILEGLSGNVCRCTGYGGIIRAVEKVRDSRSAGKLAINRINQLDQEVFIGTFGWVFEHSPWVAEKAWGRLPVKSREELFLAMKEAVEQAEESAQLQLLRAHPDLGTRLKISEVSQKEQAGVGLDQLSVDEFQEFAALNQQYVDKFGFPFIMAVKGQNKEAILTAMKQRVDYSCESERAAALQEVYKIAGFRLEELIE